MLPESTLREFAAVLRSQVPDPTWSRGVRLYRSLVHERYRGAIEATMPRATARLGPDKLASYVAQFLAEQGARTPYVRDLAREFVEWALPSWVSDCDVAPYLGDLARHELFEVELAASAPNDRPELQNDADLDSTLIFDTSAAVERYAFAVHRLPEDAADSSTPAQEDIALLGYRDADHHARFLELSPLAATMLESLIFERCPLRQAIAHACEHESVPLCDDVLTGTVALLTDLAERGVLLGSLPHRSS